MWNDADDSRGIGLLFADGGRTRTSHRRVAVRRVGRRRTARLGESQYPHASAQPAAEAISDKGRPQRRSEKNRKSFDCFKSDAGIRFSSGAVAAPEIVSPRRFLGYLLSEQKVTYRTIKEDCDSQSRAGRSLCHAEARYSLIAHPRGLRRLRPENAPRHSTFFVRQNKK